MKERGFSFTDRAEKGFLYERIIFSLREPLIMVGRANNRLFTPAHGNCSALCEGFVPLRRAALKVYRRAQGASSYRHHRSGCVPGVTSPG